MKLPIIAGLLIAAFPTPAEASNELDCLIRVIDHEAGGETTKGKEAVAYVVLNRTKSKQYPNTVCKVVQQKGQFTNFTLRKKISSETYNDTKLVANKAIVTYNTNNDPTNGALYFQNARVAIAKYFIRTIRIGGHVFFKAR